jgi:HEAT repeat protein
MAAPSAATPAAPSVKDIKEAPGQTMKYGHAPLLRNPHRPLLCCRPRTRETSAARTCAPAGPSVPSAHQSLTASASLVLCCGLLAARHGEKDEEEEIFFEIPEFSLLAATLLDESAPIAKRMRTAFLLKQVGDAASIEVLAKGLRSPSVLLGHECGYVLGQLQNKLAMPYLESVLRDTSVNPIVRHECAEALGAIGNQDAEPLLREFSTDAAPEVRETCLIALEKLAWNAANPGVTFASKYASVDPAPRTDDAEDSIDTLQQRLMDHSKTHFERYRAMFALRDRDSEAAVLVRD